MRKGLAFVSVALTLGVFGVCAAACEDSASSSNFNDNGDSGGEFDGGRFLVGDGAVGSETGAKVDCKPSLPATFAPVWKAPTKATSCAATDIEGYYDACAPKLTAPACTAWVAAHQTCATCLEAADGSGPIQPHRERLFWTLNVAGCASISLNGNDTCPKEYDAYFACQRQSCEECFGQNGATFENFKACEAAATSTGCGPYNDKRKAACAGIEGTTDAGAPLCFPTASEAADMKATSEKVAAATRSYTLRVAQTFCGP